MEYLRINQNCQGSLYTSICTGKKLQKSASSIKAIKQPALLEKKNFLNKTLHPIMQLPLVLLHLYREEENLMLQNMLYLL